MVNVFNFFVGNSPSGEYGRVIPHHGGVHTIGADGQYNVPPTLPPHLLNVILNKETEQVLFPFHFFHFFEKCKWSLSMQNIRLSLYILAVFYRMKSPGILRKISFYLDRIRIRIGIRISYLALL